jgi:hypothetical protein
VNFAAEKITLNDSKIFPGTIWNTIVDESRKVIFVETRNVDEKKVRFAAYNFDKNLWLWDEVGFEEPWWISLGYVQDEVLLLTVYDDTNNPDKKSLIALDVETARLIWWKNNFVVAHVTSMYVIGNDTKFGLKSMTLDLRTGDVVSSAVVEIPARQNFPVIRPLQYPQGTQHFETVKTFIERKCKLLPVLAIEYCEYKSLIIVSVFVEESDLANYLIVFDSEGQIVLKEQLGENLKGIAYDTFFLFAGFIIFVKNKRELVSYKIA